MTSTEWVWITHPELGDSPNPVRRRALPAFERSGWTEVTPAEGDPTAPAQTLTTTADVRSRPRTASPVTAENKE